MGRDTVAVPVAELSHSKSNHVATPSSSFRERVRRLLSNRRIRRSIEDLLLQDLSADLMDVEIKIFRKRYERAGGDWSKFAKMYD